MKKLFFIFVFAVLSLTPLEAYWCGRPTWDRYYTPYWYGWNSRCDWFYGYTDFNDQPYALPVNRYFTPCPRWNSSYDRRCW